MNNMIQKRINIILSEANLVLKDIDDYQVKLFINEILIAKNIVVIGAGRMGLAGKAFSMRLGHLGLTSFALGDSTLPKIKKKDLVIACSGSGETQTIYDLALLSKDNGARLAVISSYIDHNKSRMTKIADTVVVINAPSKHKEIKGFKSVQPMTSLNEQCLTIFFDAVVLLLMDKLNQTNEQMKDRHTILE